jgi:hypothetical protein
MYTSVLLQYVLFYLQQKKKELRIADFSTHVPILLVCPQHFFSLR